MKNAEQKDKRETKQNQDDAGMNKYEKENYVRVQDYTGEGYTLRDSNEETGEIANAHRDEVEQAVKQFFNDKYKTEVKVHNIVSAVDGVSVFVESIGEPHFYTFAIVPVDLENKEVQTDRVWSQEGQVENAIQGGLYAMAFEEEFAKLDDYLESVTEEHPVTGTPVEAIQNVMGTGYTTNYYLVAPAGDAFEKLYELYQDNPSISKQELQDFFAKKSFNPRYLTIGIELYMEEDNAPSKKIYDKVYNDIKQMEGIPKGEYTIILNDNYIDRKRAIGQKDNSIDKTLAEGIMKQ
ncbi:DUF1672 domain-containing protein [Virgibacillus dakarensis]|uniref:DUF1672 family protein n=1 Tax=Virgibacillus dakarensis TaxID=1917889 RepID=UPI00135658B8|nr:DUF1672 family protein [Virgibacillus dakarensis]MBT2215572.1 DUF1672 domain-containing protein [Virgibacillus dakarensis]